ncbi:armadillo repeat-containing protein 2 isoform X2 [Ischnura elegans]|uniref:armadillo repeat-containing protein 2 isoform X2 n=1 Tax=Ischnura elegans TaxID=197161 RepID=UPI001ED8B46D|nr:armadillo repeat-containing protein 2 isoform X2 [Ischnura elegans]
MGTKIQRQKGGLAFYELPPSVRSCAEIISAARTEMAGKRNGMVAMAPGGIRAVDTRRPFTPKESQRRLFGGTGRVGVSRPPSSVSLKYLQTEKIDTEAAKPVPWLITKPPRPVQLLLRPSETVEYPLPSVCLPLSNHSKVKLPDLAIPVKHELKTSRHVRRQFHSASLNNVPEEDEEKVPTDAVEKPKIVCKTHSFDTKVKNKKQKAKKSNIDDGDQSEIASKSGASPLCKPASMLAAGSNNGIGELFPSQNFVDGEDIQATNSESKVNNNAPKSSTSDTDHKKCNESSVGDMKKKSLKGVSRHGENEEKRICFDQIEEIILRLNGESLIENNDSKVITLLEKLYEILDCNNLLGTKLGSKKKSVILQSLYKFVERSSNELLLELARIIMGLGVTGHNLAAVCKLIFKVARSDENDNLFHKGNILELFVNVLGTAEPMEDAEACVYGYGALKFLLMNSSLLRKILGFGALELMVLHMKVINKWKMDGGIISEQTCHALFQMTGALRNVAGEEDDPFPNAFVTSGVVNELCSALYLFSCDVDIVSNASRTLSILSTHDVCCSAIMEYECSIKTLVKLLKKFPGRQDIIVRLCYVLGNIMAKNDDARLKFYNEEDSLVCLTELLCKYESIKSRDSPHLNCSPAMNSRLSASNNVDDVLIKVVRVIANMSISPVVGMNIVGVDKNEGDGEPCGNILNALLSILRSNGIMNTSELVLTLLAALNNLTFWALGMENEEFSKRQIEVAEVLHTFMAEEHKETLTEAVRVFGNLSHSKEVREYIVENGIFEKLLQLLQNPSELSKDMLIASVGILVNMMSDPDKRRVFASLMVILESANGRNWFLPSLICQVIWNYIIDSQDICADLGKNETDKLVSILADFLDEEHYFGIPEGSEVDPAISMTPAYREWEDFAAVAIDLLEKIEAFLDSYNFNAIFIEDNGSFQSR